jgi:SagB-type dehydrogenase family enzyme
MNISRPATELDQRSPPYADSLYQAALALEVSVVGSSIHFRSPLLNVAWQADAAFQDGLLAILQAAAHEPRTLEALVEFAMQRLRCERQQALQGVTDLITAGLLVQPDNSARADLDQAARWAHFGWAEAFRFHSATNRIRKMNYAVDPDGVEDKTLMRQYLRDEPSPANYSGNSEVDIALPNIPQTDLLSFTDAVRLETQFSEEPCLLDLNRLGRLLFLCVGQTGARRLPLTDRHILKTSPSGGSRHPTECYAAILDVPGVPCGVYHYVVRSHGLRSVRGDVDPDRFMASALLKPARIPFRIRIVLVLSTVPERSMYRYRESRSYRVLHYDVGHILQTISYAARAFGLKSQRCYSFDDSAVEALLGLDGFEEAGMAAVSIG